MVFAVLRAQSPSLTAIGSTQDQHWVTFVRNVFSGLIDVIPTDTNVHLCSGFMHFEFHYGLQHATEDEMIKNGRRTAKQMMSQPKWTADMNAWAAYAQVEEQTGNLRDAQKIYDTALVMARAAGGSKWGQGPNEKWRASLQIRRAYAELELQCDNAERAVHVLTSGFGADSAGFHSIKVRSKGKQKVIPPLTPTQLLKARGAYKDLIATGNKACRSTVHAVVCRALLEFLAAGFDGLCAVFSEAIGSLFDEDLSRSDPKARSVGPFSSAAFRCLSLPSTACRCLSFTLTAPICGQNLRRPRRRGSGPERGASGAVLRHPGLHTLDDNARGAAAGPARRAPARAGASENTLRGSCSSLTRCWSW